MNKAFSGVQSPTEYEKKRVGTRLLSFLGDLNPGFAPKKVTYLPYGKCEIMACGHREI